MCDVPLMKVDSNSDIKEGNPFTCPFWNDVDEAMKLLSKFSFFIKNVALNPLLSKWNKK